MTSSQQTLEEEFKVDTLVLNTQSHTVLREGELIKVTPIGFKILKATSKSS